MTSPESEPGVFEIKKYPNRRFYDVTRSRHVTLGDLYELVRDGRQIVVHDSRTGADITNVVLTQIILEHDPPKMELFPASLLHQAIQSNQQMVRSFIDQYFSQAMEAFTNSRKQFDEFLARSGFSSLSPAAPFDWVRMLIPGAARTGRDAEPRTAPEARPDSETARLNEQLAVLRAELEELKRKPAPNAKLSGRPTSRRTPKKRK